MFYYILKVAISAASIVLVSEIAKRSSLFGALVASLPLTSLLAFLWMHFEKTDNQQIAQLSKSIFYLVIPSLALFLLFPLFLNKGLAFWLSLSLSIGTTIVLYFVMIAVLRYFHIAI